MGEDARTITANLANPEVFSWQPHPACASHVRSKKMRANKSNHGIGKWSFVFCWKKRRKKGSVAFFKRLFVVSLCVVINVTYPAPHRTARHAPRVILLVNGWQTDGSLSPAPAINV